jgi:hypothetical protein
MIGLLLFLGLAQSGVAEAGSETAGALVSYPETLNKSCRNGRAKHYDECSDQLKLFAAAAARARADNKVLLVSFGAEWCIWCHVFDAYVHGGKDKFTYTFGTPEEQEAKYTATLHERAKSDVSAEAEALRRFVAENFVLLHVDASHAPNGGELLKQTGASEHYEGGLPFIFTVNGDGKFDAEFDSSKVETRRDTNDPYRGYHRGKLLDELIRMRIAALR